MYQKLQADFLFTGKDWLHNGEVLITLPDGNIEAIVAEADAGEAIQKIEGVLCPGFVNTHCHLELSHLKGTIPMHTGLVNFVLEIITKRFVEPEAIEQAIVAAEAEMLRNGIVAVGDICNTDHTLAQKQQSALHYYNFIETSGWLPAIATKRFEQAKNLWQQFSMPKSIVPHAPYSISTVLWQKIAPQFSGNVITMHNQETPAEDALFRNGTGEFLRMYRQMQIDNGFFIPSGKSSLQTVAPYFNNASAVVLVHNTFSTKDDLMWIQQWAQQYNKQLFAAICINANLYIEQQVPPVSDMIDAGIAITIGTDSLASNHSLSVLDEITTINQYFPKVPLSNLLEWATHNGARALGMENNLGTFMPHTKPGILQLKGIDVQCNSIKNAQVKRLM